jgi:hypothetical protein
VKHVWALALVAASLAGCASWQMQDRVSDLNNLTRAYSGAMEWSNFATAYTATKAFESAPQFDVGRFKDIKVTSYKPVTTHIAPDGKSMTRAVQISYVRITDMAVRTLTVQEEWKYSDPDKRWFLVSGFPQFN